MERVWILQKIKEGRLVYYAGIFKGYFETPDPDQALPFISEHAALKWLKANKKDYEVIEHLV